MMNKVLTYRSVRDGGKPVVYMAEDRHMKTASSVCPDLLQALSNLEDPEKDMVRTVVTALSSHEAFGPNRNGDAFFEDHLLRKNNYEKNGKEISCPMHKSFKHFARPYKYHINRPNSPAYGRVLESVYNNDMRRVELIVEVDKSKAPDIVDKIENYEPVDTSMGFRCMRGGDVCSVCGHTAKSRKDYCSHLKHEMLKVRPSGQRVYAINPFGKFFDISFVDDPADATSRAVWVDQLPVSMQEDSSSSRPEKQASFFKGGALSADIAIEVFGEDAEPVPIIKSASKSASPNKSANPVKRVPANIEMRPEEVKLYRRALQKMRGPRMSKKALDVLSTYGLKKVASSCAVAGIDLYPSEAQYISLVDEFPKTASRLYEEKVLVDLSRLSEPIQQKSASLSPSAVDKGLLSALATEDFLEKRSMRRPWLMRGIEKRAQNPFIEPQGSLSVEKVRQMAQKEAPGNVPKEPEGSKIQSPSDGFWSRLLNYGTFLAGAQYLLGGKGGREIAVENPELLTGLVGAKGVGNAAINRQALKEKNRMPISQSRRQRPKRRGGQDIMNSPLAFQMFMMQNQNGYPRIRSGIPENSQLVPENKPADAPVYTGGLLARSMAQSPKKTKEAQNILAKTDVVGYEKHASNQHLPIVEEVASNYNEETIDADLVYQYANQG